jgi:hypothetical protein
VISWFETPSSGYCGIPPNTPPRVPARKENRMATRENRGGIAGISTGGILVIVGILIMIFWSVLLGLIVTLVGLIAFGGFARGKWY